MNDKSKFTKSLNGRDIVALAFGAIIGWGWVVQSGAWLETAGTLGAMLAFCLGGLVFIFVGLIYAELTTMMPKCGGEHVFSLEGLGWSWSFVCTWALILGYVGVVAYEACALPSVFEYLIPNMLKGFMYEVGGFKIYATWVAISIIFTLILTFINYIGIKMAAFVQTILVLTITSVGIMLITSTSITGNFENTKPLFANGVEGMLSVLVATPFFLMGFDVIPQAAEEMNVPPRKIGKIILTSILMAIVFYTGVIFSISLTMSHPEINSSQLVAADALKKSWNNSKVGSSILIIGGIAGIISSWNAFFVGGSRCLYAMAETGMLPKWIAKIHPKYNTPYVAVLFIGGISCIAPFFGQAMLGWVSNAGSFAMIIVYFIVALAFLSLRKTKPYAVRPYKIRHWRLTGWLALILTFCLALLCIPGMPSGLGKAELIIVSTWIALGIFMAVCARSGKKEHER